MAATRKQVEELFAAVEAKLAGRGFFLEFDGSKGSVKQRTESEIVSISPVLTMTPLHQWLAVILQGIQLAQQPLPTAHTCPVCGGKLSVYEALPVERWTYICGQCEETGTATELHEIAKQNGE